MSSHPGPSPETGGTQQSTQDKATAGWREAGGDRGQELRPWPLMEQASSLPSTAHPFSGPQFRGKPHDRVPVEPWVGSAQLVHLALRTQEPLGCVTVDLRGKRGQLRGGVSRRATG